MTDPAKGERRPGGGGVEAVEAEFSIAPPVSRTTAPDGAALVGPPRGHGRRRSRIELLMDEPQAAVLAALDQAKSGTRQVSVDTEQLAALGSGCTGSACPSPTCDRILCNLLDRVSDGSLKCCPHLRPGSAEPVHWMPWAPARVRCTLCAAVLLRLVARTRENFCCDACSRYSHRVSPAAVVNVRPGGMVRISPPVVVSFGVCQGCRAALDDSLVPAGGVL